LLEEYLKDHTSEELFDEVLIPALTRARQDRDRGQLDNPELSSLVKSARELLDAVLGEASSESDAPVVVVGCPAHDEVDTLVLELLGRLLGDGKARLRVLPAEATAPEVAEQVARLRPAVVCLGTLPSAGGARSRYLCKRLSSKIDRLPIVAGIWGAHPASHLASQLIAAGATQVATSLAEARKYVGPLVEA